MFNTVKEIDQEIKRLKKKRKEIIERDKKKSSKHKHPDLFTGKREKIQDSLL